MTQAEQIIALIADGMDVSETSRDREFFLDFAFDIAADIFDDDTARELFENDGFIADLIATYQNQ